MFYVLLAFIGDCGTPYPGWWWQWWKNPPPPPPPWWFVIDIIAAAGGILGGVIAQMVSKPEPDPWRLLTSFVAAFAVGRVAGSVASRVLSGIGAKAPAQARQTA